MKTLLKVLAAIVVVVVAAVAALALFIDPNDYKGEIESLARKHADMELNINGELGWSLFPTLAIELPQVQASAIEGQSKSPVQRAEVQQAKVSVDILALLGGEVKMSGVLLDGLRLSLVAPQPTDAQAGSTEKSSTEKSTEPAQPAGEGVRLDIASVDIRDAEITYTDPQSGQRVVLKRFNFSGTDISSDEAFPVDMNFELQLFQGQNEQPELSLVGDLQAQLLLDTVNQLYRAQGLDFTLDLQTAAFKGKAVPLRVQGDMQADLNGDTAAISNLRLELANLEVSGDVTVSDMAQQPRLAGSLAVAPFKLNPLLAALGQSELETTDPDVLQTIAFNARLAGPANTLGLQDVELRLDDTHFIGSISHNLGSGAQTVKLQGDSINIDRYLPPRAAAGEESTAASGTDTSGAVKPGTASQGRYSKAPLLPLDTLKGLNFDAELGLQQLQISGLNITSLKLLATASNGLVKVNEVSGDLYQGRFNNSAVIDARKQPVALDIKKEINGIQLGGLLKDLTDKEQFSGQFNMGGQYQARGNSVYDIVHTLDGNMQLNLKDGRINGVNLTDKLCSGILQLQGKQPASSAAVDYTEFSNLSGSMTVTDGLVENRDLKAALVGVNMTGAGTVNLPQETLDYGLSLTILQELKGPNCQIDNKLHNVALPLRCQGSFDDKPTSMCRPDREAMSQVLTKLGAKELEAKAKEKVEEKLKGSVGDKLKGLFGQ